MWSWYKDCLVALTVLLKAEQRGRRAAFCLSRLECIFMPLLPEQEGTWNTGRVSAWLSLFLWPLFLLGKLPLFFSGICSAGNWHRVSRLMLHYEIVNNIFRKGGELFISSFCIFHVSYFPVSVWVIVFVTVLDECRNGASWSNVVAAGLHGVI